MEPASKKKQELHERFVKKVFEKAEFPDPATHRLCRECRLWLPKESGAVQAPDQWLDQDVISPFLALGRLFSRYQPKALFVCDTCQTKKKKRTRALFIFFFTVLAILGLLGELEII